MSDSELSQKLMQMITGNWVARSIYIVAKLRIADRLADGPRSAEELAKEAGMSSRVLYRVLRALASLDIFDQEADGRFRLNPMAAMLRENGPDSVWAFTVMVGEEHDRCWSDLPETVRTGEMAFPRIFGQPLFDYYSANPEPGKNFDMAMISFSRQATKAALDAYDMSDIGTLADVGGGLGHNLTAALNRYPKMKGLLFDLPHVVERARPRFKADGLADRCTLQGGSFFETAPSGADAYMLGHIIHDWDDVKAGLILDNLRRAIAPKARILLVEYVVPTDKTSSFSKLLDLHMLLLFESLERTEEEYRRLLAAHGFRLTRVVPTATDICVVEAVPV